MEKLSEDQIEQLTLKRREKLIELLGEKVVDEKGINGYHIFDSQNDVEKWQNSMKANWFVACFFNCDVSFSPSFFTQDNFTQNSIDFTLSIFAGEVNFSKVTFNRETTFTETQFLGKTCFEKAVFLNSAKFKSAIFYDSVEFNSAVFKRDTFFDTTKDFNNNLNGSFKDVEFEEKIVFYNRHFGKVSFENTRFNKLIDFWGATFHNNVNFLKTDFLDTCVFSNAIFKEKAVFQYSKIANNLILRDAKFDAGINLSQVNFIDNGNINIFRVIINDFSTSSPKNNDDWENISASEKRETFRILKNEAIKQNNKISALDFHAKEMQSYYDELKSESKKERTERKIRNTSVEKAILTLNRWSNGYGLRPDKGFIFTIFYTALPLFILYWLSLPNKPIVFTTETTVFHTFKAIGFVLGEFAQFINPTHALDFMKVIGDWSILIDLISRIFIGFGIYQTIQAFRKYGRW